MQQSKFQLAKEYDEQIKRLREEILNIDKATLMTLRSPHSMGMVQLPDVNRELNEFPRLKAAIKTAFEEELAEYEEKLKNL